MATKAAVAEILLKLSRIFRIENSRESHDLWCMALDDLDDKSINKGLPVTLQRHTSPYLTPAEFRQYVDAARAHPDPAEQHAPIRTWTCPMCGNDYHAPIGEEHLLRCPDCKVSPAANTKWREHIAKVRGAIEQ